MLICPYCNTEMQFMTSKEFYGTDYGTNIYVCRPCDARVGTHGKSKTSLGTPANAQLRNLRKTAHYYFDRLWRTSVNGRERMNRGKAYVKLQQLMNMTPKEAHIGNFNEEQCRECIEKLKDFYVTFRESIK